MWCGYGYGVFLKKNLIPLLLLDPKRYASLTTILAECQVAEATRKLKLALPLAFAIAIVGCQRCRRRWRRSSNGGVHVQRWTSGPFLSSLLSNSQIFFFALLCIILSILSGLQRICFGSGARTLRRKRNETLLMVHAS